LATYDIMARVIAPGEKLSVRGWWRPSQRCCFAVRDEQKVVVQWTAIRIRRHGMSEVRGA